LATMLPFGPFLALGAVCYLYWGEALLSWYWGLAS
jgi:leader peptidase (prepilin peptidase) / N-methyltransferase